MLPLPSSTIEAGAVQVWWFGLDLDPAQIEELTAVLSHDEQERVERFHFERDKRRSTAARGLLRRLLASYLGSDARDVEFEYGPQGKPSLVGLPLHFNLAHSYGLGVCAVTLDQPVGVDVELVRADFDLPGVARHSFSPAELSELAALQDVAAVRGFFRCWTLKEAYIKARGGGLSIPLDAFDVSLHGDLGAQPVVSREATPAARGWFARELAVRPDAAAAIAIRSATPAVCERQLPTR